MAPRAQLRLQPTDRTVVRGGVGRSFGRVTVIQSSSHFAGFIGQYPFSNADSRRHPDVPARSGPARLSAAARIDPSFSNNTNVDWWNGNAAMRPATYDTWTMSVQREVRPGMTVEVDYNGSRGTNLQANLLNLRIRCRCPSSTI